jgi:hypothetical protein|tara:strand:- start:236 stop:364 length:129 start_codon:yes stop_codon:yes gene_type:complete
MNNWDKVDKKRRAATEDDVRWEYAKLVIFFFLTAGYIYLMYT